MTTTQITSSAVARRLVARGALSASTGAPIRHKLLTLVFVKDRARDRLLLGLKKRGFGAGKWNGLGGKVEPGESVYEGAMREAREESGLEVRSLRRLGFIQFQFAGKRDTECLDVHVYTCDDWSGEPRECDEMRPAWFEAASSSPSSSSSSDAAIPFDSMWADDRFWFGYMLADEPFRGYFLFGDDETTIIEQALEPCPLEQLDDF